ncbi:MAG: LysE family translocator [Anaerolineae bacterium]|nr:LysE family translocator [Anaerolineae bacterium]
MLDVARLPLFIAAAISLLLLPGPAVLYIVTRSIHQGRRAGIVSVLGIQTGTLFHVTAAALGLSAILMSSALAFGIIKYLGAAYLIFLGIRTLMTRPAPTADSQLEPVSLKRIFSQGVIVNVLNPKTALFFFAFLPQFVDPARGAVGLQLLLLGCLFTGLAMLTDSSYALLAGTFGQWLKRSRAFARMQRYVAGTVYIGLGVTTALSGSSNQS